jgi:hypothetical protein
LGCFPHVSWLILGKTFVTELRRIAEQSA